MSAGVIVPLDEYLAASYRPDCDYVDGEIVERNVGEVEHSRMQTLLAGFLGSREKQWGIVVLTEQRVQVSATRCRVPDIAVVKGTLPSTPILETPPFLCIEILSRGDSLEDMRKKIDDFLNFGVLNVWLLNPRKRAAFHYTPGGMIEAKDGILRTYDPAIVVPAFDLEQL